MNEIETIKIWGLPVAMPRVHSGPLIRDGKPVMKTTVTGKKVPITIRYEPKGKDNKPHPAIQFKSDVRAAVQGRVAPYSDAGAVRVSWIAFFPRPKSLCRKKDPDGPIRHKKKPDRDNLDKTILDALTGVICKDDSQVCSTGFMEMFYCAKPGLGWGELERPHLLLKIEWITEEENLNGLLSDHGYHPPQGPTQEPGALPFGP
jgi:Holliday junction resolvase RusA-like endonuclease